MHEIATFPLPVLNLMSPSCSSARFAQKRKNFEDSRTFEGDMRLFILAWIFTSSWPKMGFWGK